MRAIDRRRFLRLAAAAAALPAGASLLDACSPASPTRAAPRALPRPGAPVSLPFHGSPIAPGLAPERHAILRVFEWRQYLAPWVVRSFEDRYARTGVRVELASFENRDVAAATVAAPGANFDVFFPTVDQLAPLTTAGVLRPLTHDYLANLANVWPAFAPPAGPYFDPGVRYSVPYTVFSTGIGWRRDLVRTQDAPPELEDPCDVFANPRYRGRVGVLDAYREPLAMIMQMQGVRDLNSAGAPELSRAADELIGFARGNGLRISEDGDYQGLATGEFAVHQAWSGDILAARRFGGADPAATDQRLAYWWMQDGGVVGCDLLAVTAAGRNPVLAHLFLNHLLDLDVAMRNFAWNGYQPPLIGASTEAFASDRWGRAVPAHLLDTTIVTPERYAAGASLAPLSPAADSAWIAEWRRVQSAVSA